jgi:hypothetical protein
MKKPQNNTSSASQQLRDLLIKKKAGESAGSAKSNKGAFKTSLKNPLQNAAPANTSRKTKKGLRPG